MKVDICSIMYNEEVMLPYWLEAWSKVPFIQNIYLVDGGSTDKSVEIAKEHGAQVIIVPWKNNFSRQRNIAIKLAKSDWLIQPDIDELPCGNIKDDRILKRLANQNINQLELPYIKFYDWDKLWFFNNQNTPNLKDDLVNFGHKSTITIFRKGHLAGYDKSLHEMPIFSGNEKKVALYYKHKFMRLGEEFLIGHFDQTKHFEQARTNGTSVEFEMGLKRVRYRLISPATYSGKVYDQKWAEKALSELERGNKEMIEELGREQLKSFMNEHTIIEDFDAKGLLNGC